MWTLGVVVFLDDDSSRGRCWLAVGAAALAASSYAQPSAVLMAPLFAAIGAFAIHRIGRLRLADVRLAVAAFMAVLVPLLLWIAMHPSSYPETLGRWALHAAHVHNPVAWAEAAGNWKTLAVTSGVFWDFFSPSNLFFNPAAPGFAGVFLLPTALLIGLGVSDVLRRTEASDSRAAVLLLILMTFVAAPAAAATFKEPRAVQRALIIVPLGVLLATQGLQMLGAHSRHAVIVVLLAAVAVQFVFCYRGLVHIA